MRFDEILRTCVVINGIKHIPYPKECHEASVIEKCDYRVHEEKPCLYADRPSMCPVFTISCLDCERIGNCDCEMYFVALTLEVSKTGLERATHPLYR